MGAENGPVGDSNTAFTGDPSTWSLDPNGTGYLVDPSNGALYDPNSGTYVDTSNLYGIGGGGGNTGPTGNFDTGPYDSGAGIRSLAPSGGPYDGGSGITWDGLVNGVRGGLNGVTYYPGEGNTGGVHLGDAIFGSGSGSGGSSSSSSDNFPGYGNATTGGSDNQMSERDMRIVRQTIAENGWNNLDLATRNHLTQMAMDSQTSDTSNPGDISALTGIPPDAVTNWLASQGDQGGPSTAPRPGSPVKPGTTPGGYPGGYPGGIGGTGSGSGSGGTSKTGKQMTDYEAALIEIEKQKLAAAAAQAALKQKLDESNAMDAFTKNFRDYQDKHYYGAMYGPGFFAPGGAAIPWRAPEPPLIEQYYKDHPDQVDPWSQQAAYAGYTGQRYFNPQHPGADAVPMPFGAVPNGTTPPPAAPPPTGSTPPPAATQTPGPSASDLNVTYPGGHPIPGPPPMANPPAPPPTGNTSPETDPNRGPGWPGNHGQTPPPPPFQAGYGGGPAPLQVGAAASQGQVVAIPLNKDAAQPTLPAFADGGSVPGATGEPVLAVVHAGETIRNPMQESALQQGVNLPLPATPGQTHFSGGGLVVGGGGWNAPNHGKSFGDYGYMPVYQPPVQQYVPPVWQPPVQQYTPPPVPTFQHGAGINYAMASPSSVAMASPSFVPPSPPKPQPVAMATPSMVPQPQAAPPPQAIPAFQHGVGINYGNNPRPAGEGSTVPSLFTPPQAPVQPTLSNTPIVPSFQHGVGVTPQMNPQPPAPPVAPQPMSHPQLPAPPVFQAASSSQAPQFQHGVGIDTQQANPWGAGIAPNVLPPGAKWTDINPATGHMYNASQGPNGVWQVTGGTAYAGPTAAEKAVTDAANHAAGIGVTETGYWGSHPTPTGPGTQISRDPKTGLINHVYDGATGKVYDGNGNELGTVGNNGGGQGQTNNPGPVVPSVVATPGTHVGENTPVTPPAANTPGVTAPPPPVGATKPPAPVGSAQPDNNNHVPYGPELTGESGFGALITHDGTPVVASEWQRHKLDPTSMQHYDSYLGDIAGANPLDFAHYSQTETGDVGNLKTPTKFTNSNGIGF